MAAGRQGDREIPLRLSALNTILFGNKNSPPVLGGVDAASADGVVHWQPPHHPALAKPRAPLLRQEGSYSIWDCGFRNADLVVTKAQIPNPNSHIPNPNEPPCHSLSRMTAPPSYGGESDGGRRWNAYRRFAK